MSTIFEKVMALQVKNKIILEFHSKLLSKIPKSARKLNASHLTLFVTDNCTLENLFDAWRELLLFSYTAQFVIVLSFLF